MLKEESGESAEESSSDLEDLEDWGELFVLLVGTRGERREGVNMVLLMRPGIDLRYPLGGIVYGAYFNPVIVSAGSSRGTVKTP